MVNSYLKEYMEGLTAKVFRTYNASWTFQEQLDKLTEDDMSTADKMLAYNRANRLVAVLCNHQRAVPKTHGQQMEKMDDKVCYTLLVQKHLLIRWPVESTAVPTSKGEL